MPLGHKKPSNPDQFEDFVREARMRHELWKYMQDYALFCANLDTTGSHTFSVPRAELTKDPGALHLHDLLTDETRTVAKDALLVELPPCGVRACQVTQSKE